MTPTTRYQVSLPSYAQAQRVLFLPQECTGRVVEYLAINDIWNLFFCCRPMFFYTPRPQQEQFVELDDCREQREFKKIDSTVQKAVIEKNSKAPKKSIEAKELWDWDQFLKQSSIADFDTPKKQPPAKKTLYRPWVVDQVNQVFLHFVKFKSMFPHFELFALFDTLLRRGIKVWEHPSYEIGRLLPNLEVLSPWESSIGEFKGLSSLTRLRELNLCTGNIEMDPLDLQTRLKELGRGPFGTTLENLYWYRDENGEKGCIDTRTLAYLEVVPLKKLVLPHRIANLDPVSGLTTLTSLESRGSKVRNFDPLSCLVNLEELSLYDTQFAKVTTLANLTLLQNLHLGSTKVYDIDALSKLSLLKDLDLSSTNVRDIGALSSLHLLESLQIYKTKVRDIRALSGLTSLRELNLNSTMVQDFSALSPGHSSLASLNLSHTGLQEVDFLTCLTALEILDISNTNVGDITPLSTLFELEELNIRCTYVKGVEALSGLSRLSYLDVSNARFGEEPLSGLESLSESVFRVKKHWDHVNEWTLRAWDPI